jgi:hypothetical protein
MGCQKLQAANAGSKSSACIAARADATAHVRADGGVQGRVHGRPPVQLKTTASPVFMFRELNCEPCTGQQSARVQQAQAGGLEGSNIGKKGAAGGERRRRC